MKLRPVDMLALPLETTHRYSVSPVTTKLSVRVLPRYSSFGPPLTERYQAYDSGSPCAFTLTVTVVPLHVVMLGGYWLIVGATLTSTTTLSTEPQVPEMRTQYDFVVYG